MTRRDAGSPAFAPGSRSGAGGAGCSAATQDERNYERWRPRFAEAIDRRLYTIGHLDALIRSGRAQAWFGEEAAIVTELRRYPTGAAVIHGLVAAGDLGEIAGTLIPRAEAWGRAIGCVMAIVESRPGWARALKRHGYAPHQLAVRKEL
jgi:hypothetical protein